MKKLFISALIFGQVFSGAVIADGSTDSNAGKALIAQCNQQAINAGASDVTVYLNTCLDEKWSYSTDSSEE